MIIPSLATLLSEFWARTGITLPMPGSLANNNPISTGSQTIFEKDRRDNLCFECNPDFSSFMNLSKGEAILNSITSDYRRGKPVDGLQIPDRMVRAGDPVMKRFDLVEGVERWKRAGLD